MKKEIDDLGTRTGVAVTVLMCAILFSFYMIDKDRFEIIVANKKIEALQAMSHNHELPEKETTLDGHVLSEYVQCSSCGCLVVVDSASVEKSIKQRLHFRWDEEKGVWSKEDYIHKSYYCKRCKE